MTNLLKLTSLCQNLECEYILDAPMKEYTTFQIGGPCDILVRPYDEGQIAVLIQFCAANGIRWQVMGNGSNLLVPDGGVSGVVQDITWRHTTIEDACGQTIIVPNSNISKNTLVHLMPFGRVAVPVAVKDTSKWASLDALADELTSATKTAVSPISGFDKEPYVLFSEIGDFGIKGKIIFIVSDDSTTFTAADACIRAIAPIIA